MGSAVLEGAVQNAVGRPGADGPVPEPEIGIGKIEIDFFPVESNARSDDVPVVRRGHVIGIGVFVRNLIVNIAQSEVDKVIQAVFRAHLESPNVLPFLVG